MRSNGRTDVGLWIVSNLMAFHQLQRLVSLNDMTTYEIVVAYLKSYYVGINLKRLRKSTKPCQAIRL